MKRNDVSSDRIQVGDNNGFIPPPPEVKTVPQIQLSDEQKGIINTRENTIVVANPGTGKTTTLSFKVIKLLEEGVRPEDILCVTYTEKAKKEMFDAIYDNSDKKFSDADLMKINIHTFHSFAYHYLQDAGLISGDIVGNNLMRFSILRSFEANQAFNYGKEYLISTIVPKTENAIRYIKSFGITPDKIDLEKTTEVLEQTFDEKSSVHTLDEMKAFLKHFVEAYGEYERSKPEAVDYSDMLLMFRENFRGDKFKHVLVDEIQDMNDIEAEIATMVAENLFLVGDAKQAIFGFQGGSVKNFKKFVENYEKKMLSSNRRSSQQILDYSKRHFLERTQHREWFEEELDKFESSDSGEIPTVISTSAHLFKILEIIEQNKGKSVGIITRTNGQIIKVSKFLDSNNISYSSTSSKASTDDAKNEIRGYLKGLLSERLEDKISATFTVFSPYSLKEAFGFSRAFRDKKFENLAGLKSWGSKLRPQDLDGQFEDVILPICVSKGIEWLASATRIKDEIHEFLSLKTPSLEGLFDFISIGEESYLERRSESKVTLTTVHKSKGRAFDIVVYVPFSSARTSFIDSITRSILTSSEIEAESELAEESLRVDFVAFTRAKEKLIIITDDKQSKNYHIENFSKIEMDDSKDEMIATLPGNRLSEAYSLFIKGRFDESKSMLKKEDDWVREYIINYFKTADHFSYSSVKTEPYKFLKDVIIRIPWVFSATDFGSKVHDALEKILTGSAAIEEYEGDVKRAVQNGLDCIDDLRAEFPGLKIDSTEKHAKILVSSMTDYDDDKLEFSGYIDAVFKHDDGVLIVDYKTDKNANRASEHKRQLAVYKKMYSILEGIPEDKISTCVIFVALRGGVRTDKFERKVSMGTRDVFGTFENHLKTVLGWRRDPESFIEALLNEKSEETLYLAIKEKLTHQKPTLS